MAYRLRRKGFEMFGLPGFTVLVMTVIPLSWIIYTAGFYFMTRDWANADEED